MPSTISIVIVSWNVSQLLRSCIRSIYASEGNFNLEIVVVDNNSSDDTVPIVKSEFPDVVLICNKTNPGFARANNQGFKIAKGEYIFILNPDTEIDKNCIAFLLQAIESSDEIGMAGPKLIYNDGRIQHTCARKLPSLKFYLLNKVFRLRGREKNETSDYYSYKKYIEAISGAAMFISARLLFDIKMFREDYIHCGEDIDLCYRIGLNNKKIIFVPEAIVIHYAGQSSKQDIVRSGINTFISQQKYYYYTKGKLEGILFRIIVSLIQMPVDFLVSVFKYLSGKIDKNEFNKRITLILKTLAWKPIN